MMAMVICSVLYSAIALSRAAQVRYMGVKPIGSLFHGAHALCDTSMGLAQRGLWLHRRLGPSCKPAWDSVKA